MKNCSLRKTKTQTGFTDSLNPWRVDIFSPQTLPKSLGAHHEVRPCEHERSLYCAHRALPPLQIFLTKLQRETENTKGSPIWLCSDGWTCCLWPSEGAASPRREAWLCLGGNLHLVDWGTKPHCGMNSTTPWAGARAEHKVWTSAFSLLLPYYVCSVTATSSSADW